MALSLDALETSLLRVWLPAPGGPWNDSPRASGERFADAVVQWFADAQCAPARCVTAAAKRAPLAATAAVAFHAWHPHTAGTLLAQGLAAYVTAHTFLAPGVTPGLSGPPAALAAVTAELVAVFSDVDLSLDARAARIAAACTTLATSSLVTFAPPPPVPPPITLPPAPIT